MCGIFFTCAGITTIQNQTDGKLQLDDQHDKNSFTKQYQLNQQLCSMLHRRGPDYQWDYQLISNDDKQNQINLEFYQYLLQLRGMEPMIQSMVDKDENVLLFNGEIYSGVQQKYKYQQQIQKDKNYFVKSDFSNTNNSTNSQQNEQSKLPQNIEKSQELVFGQGKKTTSKNYNQYDVKQQQQINYFGSSSQNLLKEKLNLGFQQKESDLNDGFCLFELLVKSNTKDDVMNLLSGDFRGPWSLIFYHKKTNSIYFGKDHLGRRSLLYGFQNGVFILSSVVLNNSFQSNQISNQNQQSELFSNLNSKNTDLQFDITKQKNQKLVQILDQDHNLIDDQSQISPQQAVVLFQKSKNQQTTDQKQSSRADFQKSQNQSLQQELNETQLINEKYFQNKELHTFQRQSGNDNIDFQSQNQTEEILLKQQQNICDCSANRVSHYHQLQDYQQQQQQYLHPDGQEQQQQKQQQIFYNTNDSNQSHNLQLQSQQCGYNCCSDNADVNFDLCELPPGIFSLDLSTFQLLEYNRKDVKILELMEYSRIMQNILPNISERSDQLLEQYVREGLEKLAAAVHTRCSTINSCYPYAHIQHAQYENIGFNLRDAPVMILFSGGVDSTLIAALSHLSIQADVPIDLVNVCFDNGESPDRLSALDAFQELQSFAPDRQFRLILIDSDLDEVDQIRDHLVAVLQPCDTVMDFNIGAALWLAAKGTGYLFCDNRIQNEINPTQQISNEVNIDKISSQSDFCSNQYNLLKLQKQYEYLKNEDVKKMMYTSQARVVLLGHGADEQCGGYGRHRTKFREAGWEGLHNELAKDVQNLWIRNLGRDDRLVADHGREARHPFLDEDFMQFILKAPLEIVCDATKEIGIGDKQILREMLKILGLPRAAKRVKRAIQFGTRIGKLFNKRDFGSNRAANLKSAGQVRLKDVGRA